MSDRTAIINGLILNEETGAIRIGRGATGYFTAKLGVEAGAFDTETDVVMFVITKPAESKSTLVSTVNGVKIADTSKGEECVLKRFFGISTDDDGKAESCIALTNADTRVLTAGAYLWNAMVITDASFDSSGNVIIENSDTVVPFYVDGERPKFTVEEVGCIV